VAKDRKPDTGRGRQMSYEAWIQPLSFVGRSRTLRTSVSAVVFADELRLSLRRLQSVD
jgi:hypothetical protein